MKKIGFREKKNVLGSDAEKRKEELKKKLEEVTQEKVYFSASKIQCYKDCPLKYKFKYVDKIQKPITAPALTIGTTFHKVVEYIYTCKAFNTEVETDVVNEIVEKNLDRSLCGYMNDQEWKETIEATKKISNYYNDHKRKPMPLVVNGNVCSEVAFDIPLIDPITNIQLKNVYLRGSFDLITDDLRIIDAKTAARAYSEGKVATSVQMTVYSYAFRQMFKQKEEGILFDVVIKREPSKSNPTGEPQLVNYPTERGQQDFVKMFHAVKEIIRAEKYNVFCPIEPHDGSYCKNCEYKEECLNWTGNIDIIGE